jgi:hypothetical protein
VAWFVSKLAAYSAAHGGPDQSWFFLNVFAVIALAPKGYQGLLYVEGSRSGSNQDEPPAKAMRLALYGGIWLLLLVSGTFGVFTQFR